MIIHFCARGVKRQSGKDALDYRFAGQRCDFPDILAQDQ